MIRKDMEERIRGIVEPAIIGAGMELVCVECFRMKSRWLVRIYIDKEGGVAIDDCALISGEAGDLLAVHDVPHESYTLEVSSPGLDRPLVKDEDFRRFRGSKVTVRTGCKIDGARNFKGILREYLTSEDGTGTIVLETEGRRIAIPREEVIRARLEYVWND
ncbi:MAG: ribosome maturation factor RimP [Pseudomonadota bacterium]|nr:ribosome maturation factor RimP [Pseudomonadota bacterium]